MTALAKDAVRYPLLDVTERTFADLSRAEEAALRAILRPLPWIDGLVTALCISPAEAEPDDWLDHIWAEGQLEKLPKRQVDDALAIVTGQHDHVACTLFDAPEDYQPFLSGASDDLAAASQWAAGFRFGIRLQPEPWAPLIDDDDAGMVLALICYLEGGEGLSQEERANSPFADLPATQLQKMRRETVPLLRTAIIGLHFASLCLLDGWLDDDVDEPAGPYHRSGPKVGRNDPCPCGSGKRYKKCCLDRLESDLE